MKSVACDKSAGSLPALWTCLVRNHKKKLLHFKIKLHSVSISETCTQKKILTYMIYMYISICIYIYDIYVYGLYLPKIVSKNEVVSKVPPISPSPCWTICMAGSTSHCCKGSSGCVHDARASWISLRNLIGRF